MIQAYIAALGPVMKQKPSINAVKGEGYRVGLGWVGIEAWSLRIFAHAAYGTRRRIANPHYRGSFAFSNWSHTMDRESHWIKFQ